MTTAHRTGPLPESIGWNITATMLSGLLCFGLPSWAVARWLGQPWLVAPGLLFGMALALALIWLRYGRPES
ncbi:MAG: hypothetical protein ACRC0L_07050 [Angustibacter sp.]